MVIRSESIWEQTSGLVSRSAPPDLSAHAYPARRGFSVFGHFARSHERRWPGTGRIVFSLGHRPAIRESPVVSSPGSAKAWRNNIETPCCCSCSSGCSCCGRRSAPSTCPHRTTTYIAVAAVLCAPLSHRDLIQPPSSLPTSAVNREPCSY